jgi:hypothetical protein
MRVIVKLRIIRISERTKEVVKFIKDFNDDELARQLMKIIGNVVVPDHVSKV